MSVTEEYKAITSQFAELQILLEKSKVYEASNISQKSVINESYVNTMRVLSDIHNSIIFDKK